MAVDDSQIAFSSAPVTPRHRYNSLNCTSSNYDSPNEFTEPNDLQSYFSDFDQPSFTLEGKPFLETIFQSLELADDKSANDYDTLFALGLIFAICQNQGPF